MKCEINDRIIATIQRLKDGALKYYGNAALQDAVDVQMWLQEFVQREEEVTSRKPDVKKEKK